MGNFLEEIVETIKTIKTWKQVTVIMAIVFLGLILSDVDRFWNIVDDLLETLKAERPLYVEIYNTELKELITDFDRKYNTATGVGVLDQEQDIFLIFLNPYRLGVWDSFGMEEGTTFNIAEKTNLDLLNTQKCIFLPPVIVDTPFNNITYYGMACELLGNTASIFTFIEIDESVATANVEECLNKNLMPDFSRLSNKLERRYLKQDFQYQNRNRNRGRNKLKTMEKSPQANEIKLGETVKCPGLNKKSGHLM